MTAHARKLLVVEDDPGLQSQLRWCFDGYDVLTMGDRTHALEQIRRHKPPVVTLDLGLPPDPNGSSEGLATLTQILEMAPHTKVIVVTGNNDRDIAVHAVGMGAYDFFNKPINAELLGFLVNRAYRMHELETENRRLVQGKHKTNTLDGLVTCSSKMHTVCQTIEKVAPSNASVLLLGESGTGKELCARALHDLGVRAAENFIAINCAAIPENLLESELFGYEKGSFTGANRQARGKIEYADKGTLFLDEVGDLPLPLQAKLLRFLQERTLERVGGREEIPVDVRVVCATHQDLRAKITTGAFREDLYYRISEIVVQIPPLRDREGDALLLARSFLDEFAEEHGRTLRGFTTEALAAIESYNWPGNVRELKNRVKRATIMAEGKHVNEKDLELEAVTGKDVFFNLREVREHAERSAILRALGHSGGKVSQAAELLGVTRPTLYDLMRKYSLKA
jgi:two-component system NtrC family response regulator